LSRLIFKKAIHHERNRKGCRIHSKACEAGILRGEKIKFTEQFNTILGYIDKLNELNTDNVEPLSHVIELGNVFREDKVKPSTPREDALKNAPSRSEEFFKVPKVIPPR
jgi:aspartyl-tRNA(Asn)/glutamyl-tRNA(Gln) amidotransferase subunit C